MTRTVRMAAEEKTRPSVFLGLNGIRVAEEEVLAEKQGKMNRSVARRRRRAIASEENDGQRWSLEVSRVWCS